jgi:hypothetical protein
LLVATIAALVLAAYWFSDSNLNLPKEACDLLEIQPCDSKSVDAFSKVDLNGDGEKEVIFAYGGGSCGEQHYVYAKRNRKWVEIGGWCGMDGGGYTVMLKKKNGYFDIDTGVGIARYSSDKYSNTTLNSPLGAQ